MHLDLEVNRHNRLFLKVIVNRDDKDVLQTGVSPDVQILRRMRKVIIIGLVVNDWILTFVTIWKRNLVLISP